MNRDKCILVSKKRIVSKNFNLNIVSFITTKIKKL